MKTPTLEQGLQALLQSNSNMAVAKETFQSVDELFDDVEPLPDDASALDKLQHEIQTRFPQHNRVGHLIQNYILQDQAQMRRMTDLGKYPLLRLISQGVTLPDISRELHICLLYTSPSPRDATLARMPSSA